MAWSSIGETVVETFKRQSLGLVGFGAFGRLVAQALDVHFDLVVHDPAYEQARLADGSEVAMRSLQEIARCDVVVLAVPVGAMRGLCVQLGPMLAKGTLLVDVGSVKMQPMAIMVDLIPAHVEILGTHPLFGPQSVGRSLAGKKIALCPVRGARWRLASAFLRRLGLDVIVTTAQEHDQELATVQGLTHLIAKVIVEMGPLPDRLTTASFECLMNAVNMVKDDSPAVRNAIEASNPFSADVRGTFFETAAHIQGQFDVSSSP